MSGHRLLLVLASVLSVAGYGFQRADEAALVAEKDDAIEKVKQIVNQPVAALPFAPGGVLGTFERVVPRRSAPAGLPRRRCPRLAEVPL